LPTVTFTPDTRPPTPALDLGLPGAYCIPPGGARAQGLVTRVLTGDTIEVATGNQTWLVRYIGLDAPSVSAPAEWQGAQSFSLNQSLVGGKSVTLIQDVTDTSPEGYRPRYVISDGSFVNYELLRQGMAQQVELPPDLACRDAFISAQVEAQSVSLGVWQPTPIPTDTPLPTATITTTPRPMTPTSPPPYSCNRRYTCNNFNSRQEAQSCFNYCLNNTNQEVLPDRNRNGRVCEGSD
jgi:micrococcal nuclease